MCASAWNVLLPTLKISQWTNYEYKGSLRHAAIQKPFPVFSSPVLRKELLIADFRDRADLLILKTQGAVCVGVSNRQAKRPSGEDQFVSTCAFGSGDCLARNNRNEVLGQHLPGTDCTILRH